MNGSPSPSRWIVLKLGPSEIADPAAWRAFASIIRLRIKEGFRPLVVVPALLGMPELLWEDLRGPRKGRGPRKREAFGREQARRARVSSQSASFGPTWSEMSEGLESSRFGAL